MQFDRIDHKTNTTSLDVTAKLGTDKRCNNASLYEMFLTHYYPKKSTTP